MRNLTEEEHKLLAERKERFSTFFDERLSVLKDFMERLNLADPVLVAIKAENFLLPLDLFLKEQDVDSDLRPWILTRLGYYIGELLVQKLNGIWFVNEIADSRYFARYVVGKFMGISNKNAMIDPFLVAEVALSEATKHGDTSLTDLINEILNDLKCS
jgi:hypothetical protein